MAKTPGYQVPTLKITREAMGDQERLYQALVDYSNDLQGFLQRLTSIFNQNFRLNPSTLAGAGYITLPNGVMIQWMQGSANDPGVSNQLPTPFPNNIWAGWACIDGAAAPTQELAASLTDKQHITVITSAAGAVNCFILAIGN